MNRLNFYNIVAVDGVQELDFLNNTLAGFKMQYPISFYQVTGADLMRPDMISYKNYGTVNYWWIILFINGIADPFYDMHVGDILIIPSLVDLYNFYKSQSIR
jgi:hypothetical protein